MPNLASNERLGGGWGSWRGTTTDLAAFRGGESGGPGCGSAPWVHRRGSVRNDAAEGGFIGRRLRGLLRRVRHRGWGHDHRIVATATSRTASRAIFGCGSHHATGWTGESDHGNVLGRSEEKSDHPYLTTAAYRMMGSIHLETSLLIGEGINADFDATLRYAGVSSKYVKTRQSRPPLADAGAAGVRLSVRSTPPDRGSTPQAAASGSDGRSLAVGDDGGARSASPPAPAIGRARRASIRLPASAATPWRRGQPHARAGRGAARGRAGCARTRAPRCAIVVRAGGATAGRATPRRDATPATPAHKRHDTPPSAAETTDRHPRSRRRILPGTHPLPAAPRVDRRRRRRWRRRLRRLAGRFAVRGCPWPRLPATPPTK